MTTLTVPDRRNEFIVLNEQIYWNHSILFTLPMMSITIATFSEKRTFGNCNVWVNEVKVPVR